MAKKSGKTEPPGEEGAAGEPAAAAVKDEGPVKKEKVEEDEELDGEPVEQAEKKELRLAEVTIEAISQIWFRRIESWLRS